MVLYAVNTKYVWVTKSSKMAMLKDRERTEAMNMDYLSFQLIRPGASLF
jgi:hypothetical protein